MSRKPRGATRTVAAALTLVAGIGLTTAGCGSGGGADDGKVSITVNCEPPKTQKADRAHWEADVAAFEKLHPNITIVSHDQDPCDNPQTFNARLAGGQMENVFYAYYTDTAHVITSGQAADLNDYRKNISVLKDLKPADLKLFQGTNGHLYGLPKANYSMGLVYSRAVFQRAGLNPDQPPATWDEVRADAKKISALGNGTVGYADYSASNQGGWHFAAEVFSRGGDMVSKDGKKAAFDSDAGRAVLTTLKQMRWTDNSMGSKQLLTIPDVQQLMGADKLGMYLAAPDNIPQIVQKYQGSYQDLALAPMPGGRATLLGGDGYLFNVKDTPAQIRAGLLWLQYENLTPGKGKLDYRRARSGNDPVGLPQPDLFTGATGRADISAKSAAANVPQRNYAPFAKAGDSLTGKIEPPDAQQLYSVLDGVMSAVLTDRNADPDALLSQSSKKADTLLAAAQ